MIAAYVPIFWCADVPMVGDRQLGITDLIAQYCNAIQQYMSELGSGQHSNHIPV